MIRYHVIEFTDSEIVALLSEHPDSYDLSTARQKLSSTAEPAVTLTALRLIAEGSDRSAEFAREALEKIGDRLPADAREGPP